VLFLSEQVTWRLILCSVVILGGIALVLAQQRKPDVARSSG
jgi:drug/metabolite transporter (DMT)-like permease